MAKKRIQHNKGKVLAGAVIGGALGLVAGMLLPASAQRATKKKAKEITRDAEAMTVDFYKSSLAPHLKKIKKVGAKEFDSVIDQATKSYGKAKNLSAEEIKNLQKKAEHYWHQVQKHL